MNTQTNNTSKRKEKKTNKKTTNTLSIPEPSAYMEKIENGQKSEKDIVGGCVF